MLITRLLTRVCNCNRSETEQTRVTEITNSEMCMHLTNRLRMPGLNTTPYMLETDEDGM